MYIFFSFQMSSEDSTEYNLIGLDTCMGDHKVSFTIYSFIYLFFYNCISFIGNFPMNTT